MLDRVRIWDGENGNVHIELKDEDDVPFSHTVIPPHEWKELRDNMIKTFPANVSVSLLTDYLVALGIHALEMR
ncbi:hypothetical protein HWC80_gp060 [Mycobacterium phage Indlulamithi]|uniref:Uncharacterized protein n=1 Tax=Mycobacterium phage Indlulamithi TaxID=2656582 RepID=A0A649VDA8_9CAUD|nr:hypothetical protein HWC80_gp060 [Mycobacterium phage Indlulamithi]QGJ90099.1 hypothetical protein PBI_INDLULAMITHI_60 [Mycobacterium phage Indlulamithi]